jgi:protein SCO1/2
LAFPDGRCEPNPGRRQRRYVYDPEIDQYAHASGIVVITPDGQVSRYLFGVRFPERDLRLALVESSDGSIGSPVDELLLLCYRYDPATGQYGFLIMNLLRAGGALTAAGLAGYVLLSRRSDRRSAKGAGGDRT